jgi:hypothetical protein
MIRKLIRTTVVALAAVLGSSLLAGPAMAQSTLNFNATFHESYNPNSPFACLTNPGCGSGEVIGLGQVTETILFGGWCGGSCDLRTITFANGTKLVTEELFTNPQIPGQSYHSHSGPFSGTLTDTVDGALSTGMFAGASGTLTGDASAAGGTAIIDLSGPITLS